MVRIPRGAAPAVRANVRRERRGRADWNLLLHRTHRFAVGATSIATGTAFPDRLRPISWWCSVLGTGASPNGLICEFGDSTTAGFAIYLDSGALGVAAGHVSDNNEGATVDPSFTLSNGELAHIGVVLVPGSGRIEVYERGRLLVIATTAGGSLEATNGWSTSGDGGYGVAVQGTVTPRVPVGARVAPSNFDVVSPLSAFVGQRPRG